MRETHYFSKLEVSYIVSLNVAKTYANLLKAILRKRFNSHEVGLRQKHGRHFIVLRYYYGGRDVM